MATSVDLISNGAGEGLYYCLNAMASLFHGGRHSFVASIMVISSMFAAAIAVYKMVLEQRLQIPAQWLLVNSMLTVALTIPTANVSIIDRATGFKTIVSNVPWLFAVPAGHVSQIGDVIAKQIDIALKVPAAVSTPLTFREVITAKRQGAAMNAKLIANASHFNFVSHDMANNVREFVKECVYYDLALGRYRVEELRNAANIWKFISANAGQLGGVIYQSTDAGPINREFLTCEEAAVKIQQDWSGELKRAYKFYGKKLFPYGGGPTNSSESEFKKNLIDAYSYLTGISKSADELMQQNIMSNAIQDGFMARAQEDGATASIQSYAVARAQAYQDSVYAIQGGVAEKAVAYMKIVIEIIFYGMFPFVAIMLMLPGGINILKTYFIGLIWLQSWAPLYSLINMIIHVYCRNSTFAATVTLGDSALTMDTIPALGAAGVSVARYAGYAMMSVPFLSWGLFKYGGGALAQMSSYMGQPTQSASGMAAGEVTSGNMSFGVRNFDSTSRNNVNSFKQDDSASIRSGSTSYQKQDGSNITVTSGGHGIIDKVSSMSKLGVGLNDKNEVASSMNEMSSQSLNRAQTSLIGYSKTMGAAYDQMQDFRKSRGDSLANDSSIGMDQSSSMSKSIQKVENAVQSYSKIMGVDERTATETLAGISGSISGSLASPKIRPLFGLPVEAQVTGSAGVDARKTWLGSEASNVNTSSQEQLHLAQEYKDGMDEVSRISKSESFRNSSTEAANFSDGFSSKMSEAQTYKRDMQNSLTESEAWQQSANHVSSSSVGVTDDLSQDFVNYAAMEPDAYGYEMGTGGVSEAMNDPVRRKQLVDGFMESHKNKIFKSYARNKVNDEAGINAAYQNSQAGTQGEQDVRNKGNQMSQIVMNASSSHGLDKPVNTELKDKAEAQFNANSKLFNDRTQEASSRAQQLEQDKNNFDANHPKKEK